MVEENGFNKKVYADENFLGRIHPTHSKELKSYAKSQGIWGIYSPTDVIHNFFLLFLLAAMLSSP